MKRLKIDRVRLVSATNGTYVRLGNGPHRTLRERDYRKLMRVVEAARAYRERHGVIAHSALDKALDALERPARQTSEKL